jgi:hypothetical protein
MSEHGGMDADAFRHLSPQYTCRSCCSAETFRLAPSSESACWPARQVRRRAGWLALAYRSMLTVVV